MPEGSIPQLVLRSFVRPAAKLVVVPKEEPCFFESLFVPEAFMQGTYPQACTKTPVARLLSEHILGKRALPLIVLVEREKRRSILGCGESCRPIQPSHHRGRYAWCWAFQSNFHATRRARDSSRMAQYVAIYGNIARDLCIDFRHILTPGSSYTGDNALAEIPVIILEIRRILQQDGYFLDPPIIKTNPARNAEVVIR
eukprot:IDg5646t1